MSSENIYGCSPFMGDEGKYHYTYRITNIAENKHYYGVRTSKFNPYEDLGKRYFSSSKFLKPLVMDFPHQFKFKILQCFRSRFEANAREMFLHRKFDVGPNNKFYNRASSRSSRFDCTGMVRVYEEGGNSGSYHVPVDDSRIKSGELIVFSSGTVVVVDSEGNTFRVAVDDSRYVSGELKHVNTGMVVVVNEEGEFCSVSVNSPKYKSGELKHISEGMVMAKDREGNALKVKSSDIRLSSGELVGIMKGRVTVRDSKGNALSVPIDDPRYVSGELRSINEGTIFINDGENNKKINRSDAIPEGWVLGRINKNKIKTRYIHNGATSRRIPVEDPIPEGWQVGGLPRKR